MIEIDIYKDYVTICNQVVRRPARISPSQWIDHWERIKEGLFE